MALLALIISSSLLSAKAGVIGEQCNPTNFKDLRKLSSDMVESLSIEAMKSDRTVDLFKKILPCKHRLWNTSLTTQGTKAVYFVDVNAKTACLYNAESQTCQDESPTFFQDNVKADATKDLSGYSIVPGGSGRTETLIINSSQSDMITKLKDSADNKRRFDFARSRIEACRQFTSEKTITLNQLKAPNDSHELTGFIMHEDLHLYQRKWKGPNLTLFSHEKLQTERKNARSEGAVEVYHLWERLSYHILQALLLYHQNDSVKSRREFALARSYFERFKNKYPQSLHDLDSKQEGTASYIEVRAKILSQYGCNLSDNDLDKKVTDALFQHVGRHATIGPSEYVLSALASQAMQVFGVSEWQRKIEEQSESPLSILFSELKGDAAAHPNESNSLNLAKCLTKKKRL